MGHLSLSKVWLIMALVYIVFDSYFLSFSIVVFYILLLFKVDQVWFKSATHIRKHVKLGAGSQKAKQ